MLPIEKSSRSFAGWLLASWHQAVRHLAEIILCEEACLVVRRHFLGKTVYQYQHIILPRCFLHIITLLPRHTDSTHHHAHSTPLRPQTL
jgi:hypothetical protein